MNKPNVTIKYEENACFLCGINNPNGFKVAFVLEGDDGIYFDISIPPIYQGYDGIVHGGLVSAVLDEAMANCFFQRGIDCLTVEMKVNFKKALSVNHKVRVHGRITSSKGKIGNAEAWIIDSQDIIYAKGEGKFYLVPDNALEKIRRKSGV